jgi:hypothetical protein
MSFRLSGEVKDKVLFRSVMDAGIKNGGKVFYREDNQGNIIDVVYFSGAKRVSYIGEIDQEFANILRAEGFRVKDVSFDEEQGILKIVQE